ncbi:MAG: histidine kinase [Bacteroidales bacterium]|nr:histidine kinase [Bacteroidales bacterium]
MIAIQNIELNVQKWKLIVVFLLSFSFLFSIQSYSQNPEPVFRRYTVDNGLPSSVVYHVFQDTNGYIWFATANGVSRYDGYKFENFDLQSGLVDNDVFEIYEDYKQRIWFIPMSGKLSYFENGKVVSYQYNNKIKDHLPSSRGPIKCSFYVDSLDNVYLGLKQFGLISISPEGIYRKHEVAKEINISAEELPNRRILISSPNHFDQKYFRFHGVYQSFKISLLNLIPYNGYTHHHLFFQTTPDSSLICSLMQSIFKVKNGKVISNIRKDQEIIWMSIDSKNNLWVAPQGGGIECYPNYEIEGSPQMNFLRDIQVTSVLQDREGAYWFSSLNDGVFYCSEINLVNYSKENGLFDNRINAITANHDGAYIGYEFGFVDLLKNNKIKHFYSNNNLVKYSSVRSILIDSLSKSIWVSSIDKIYLIKNNQVMGLGRTPNNITIYPREVIKSSFGGYWIGSTTGLVKYVDDKYVYDSEFKKDFTGLIYNLVEDNHGVVWFCTINGLWKYFNGSYLYQGTENQLLAQIIVSIIQNPIDSSLWLGTNGNGIVIYKNGKTSQLTQRDGLISNSIHKLYYSRNNVWAATRQGLSRIIINHGKYTIHNFTNANGLPTNEVTAVYEVNNKVYVGTSKGLTVFDKRKVTEDKTAPKVIIKAFSVNNKQIDLTLKHIDLKYDQNVLNFDFVGFVYRKQGNALYRYRMLGVDTTWVQTQTPNCLFSGLSHGNYKFEVEVQSYTGIWSSIPASISFTIQPPFWKRTWFLLTGTLFFTIIIFFIFKIRVNSIKRRNDLLQNINLYKQQSLRQQMNPHFIFNTLNSIQLYILERDPISSHKYLTKFARLMRVTLDNSLNSTIPLRDEIEALRLYLDLEKIRLEGKFDYTIDYGEKESILLYRIPTLLIQPFVENAIWHGIMLKEDKTGWVKISLVDNGRIISCTIEDNGVGRRHADTIQQLRTREYKSRGSQITQQRIDLLSLMYKEQFNIIYEDLTDNLGLPLGTRVLISIPKEINTNIQV